MGYFGTLVYSEGRWRTGRPTAVPFLMIDIHDSDIATVDYRAADASGGRFFLGWEPRLYFDEPDASAPVDTDAQAEGFARWVRDAVGTEIDPAEVRKIMASPGGVPPTAEVVEESVESLLTLAGLPTPEWPTDDDAPAG